MTDEFSDVRDSGELERILRIAVSKLPKPVRMRAQSSLDGFDRAFSLLEIDREMASFRAITAQEEAAAALFRALQVRRYPGADRLDLKRHDHKAALWPVLDAARMALSDAFRNIEFTIAADPPKIVVGLKLSNYVENLMPELAHAHLELVHPFDMLSSTGGKPVDFGSQLQQIVELHGEATIRSHVRSMANSRNRILYASDQALPLSQATAKGLLARKRQATTALCLAIGILQTRTHQTYAMQVLDCFLRILDRAEGIVMPYAKGPQGQASDVATVKSPTGSETADGPAHRGG